MLDNAIPQGFEDAVELRRKNRETVVKYMNTKGQDRLRRHELFVEDGCGGLSGENVGVYGINQGDLALNSGNYDLSYQGNNLTITKALLNVIADAKTKVYGDADPALTYQVSGLKNGDTAGAVLNGGSLSRVAGAFGPKPGAFTVRTESFLPRAVLCESPSRSV